MRCFFLRLMQVTSVLELRDKRYYLRAKRLGKEKESHNHFMWPLFLTGTEHLTKEAAKHLGVPEAQFSPVRINQENKSEK